MAAEEDSDLDEFETYDQSQIPSLQENSSDSETDENEPPPKKRRGKDASYVPFKQFASMADYSVYWSQESPSWRQKRKHSLADADVVTWYCKYGRVKGYNCEVRLRTVFPHDNDSVSLEKSDVDHNHEPIEQACAMTDAVKDFVREQTGNGVAPQRIRVLLSEKGIAPMPSLKQVQNLVHRYRSAGSSGPFTDEQLKAYCESKAPNGDVNEPYVACWKYDNQDKFFVLWTTARLLDLQKSQSLLQADCTNCCNWLGFPLGAYGFTDPDRHFTPTFLSVGPVEDSYHYESVFSSIRAEGYEPQYVLGDGCAGLTKAVKALFPEAERLMCYPHVDRRVQKHIGTVPALMRDRIRSDINALRFARSTNEFRVLARLMMATWPEEAAQFKEYFTNTWVDSDVSQWHGAASPFCDNNNGLESINKGIKEAHTLRQKLPFERFLKAVESTLRLWSKDAKIPASKPTPRPQLYRDAYALQSGSDKRLVVRIPNRDIFVYAASGSQLTNLEQVKAAYRAFIAAPSTWDNYLLSRFKVHVVKKQITDTAVLYTCSCPEGYKKSLCKHSLHAMCSPDIAMYTYPPEATAQPFEQRRKPGRPKKVAIQNRYACV